ncbi:helix-turn-helix domain-containing protein [Salinarimonas sp. NSM]|uniref:helix-turn-helix domain-containing protein n=1 Tax=Salinarimonas sp. NSM TaxID=3458003 RepID=UPI004036BD61
MTKIDPGNDVAFAEKVAPEVDPALLFPENRLDEREAAAFLKNSVNTLRNWRVTGKGPRFLKIGGSVQYLRTDLLAYLAASLRTSTSDTGGAKRRARA